jgi:hypothetical protein
MSDIVEQVATTVLGENPLPTRDTHQLLLAELLIVGAVKGKRNFDREGLARAADAVRQFRHRYALSNGERREGSRGPTTFEGAARLSILSVPDSWAGD